jgi:hypothetical protein
MERMSMKRSKPMARRWIRRREAPNVPPNDRPMAPLRALTCIPNYSGCVSGVTVQKENALQHTGYMKAVRDLGYCMLCRVSCRPQFCHRDCGKGTGIKTDCREGWPGCAHCHWVVGTSGQYHKQERRALELDLGWRTRQAVNAAGTWPARLPMWTERTTP